MKKPISSFAIGVCLLALSAGAAFATDLHGVLENPPPGTFVGPPNGTGQTGSNILSNCNPAMMPPPSTSFGAGFTSGGAGGATNKGMNTTANGSPFNGSVAKQYAGNPGNPATNPKAVAQYDNACAQHSLH